MSDWYALGPLSLIRIWEPGDGMRCTLQGNSRCNCGEPVAVIKDANSGSGCRSVKTIDPVMAGYIPNMVADKLITYTRVVCLRHLAARFDSDLGSAAERNADQLALEELAKRYWDQYESIRNRMHAEIIEARFSSLPNELRDKVIAIARESEKAS